MKFQSSLERRVLSALLIYIFKIVTFAAWIPPWRNGLAHWTSNSKVVGSSPTGGAFFSFFFLNALSKKFKSQLFGK